nr:MTH938/NDUFAF3 family protein [uncultured Cohaesibacter sp.]
MTDAYYPGHDPIDHYGNGGFRFGPMSHQGALLFLPSGIRRWNAESVSSLTLESFDPILREAEGIEILILGSGPHLVPLELTLATKIRAAGIKLDVIDTGAAVRTLNILLSEDRAVAAALLPVD